MDKIIWERRVRRKERYKQRSKDPTSFLYHFLLIFKNHHKYCNWHKIAWSRTAVDSPFAKVAGKLLKLHHLLSVNPVLKLKTCPSCEHYISRIPYRGSLTTNFLLDALQIFSGCNAIIIHIMRTAHWSFLYPTSESNTKH